MVSISRLMSREDMEEWGDGGYVRVVMRGIKPGYPRKNEKGM